MVQALGGNPTPIPYGEVYQALIQGVVDGAENNWPSYESSRHFEVAPYFSLTRHVMAPEVLVASMRSWKKMSTEEQAYLTAAAWDSVPIMRDVWDRRVADSRRRVLAAGVELVSEIDHDAFARRMRPMWDRYVVTAWMQTLVDDIVAMGTERDLDD
jgi:TRAP-type C4-dicarboxylate transport system substrate-binding protein